MLSIIDAENKFIFKPCHKKTVSKDRLNSEKNFAWVYHCILFEFKTTRKLSLIFEIAASHFFVSKIRGT